MIANLMIICVVAILIGIKHFEIRKFNVNHTRVNDTGDNAKLFKTEQMANGESYVKMSPAKNLRRCRNVRNIARSNHNLLAAKKKTWS